MRKQHGIASSPMLTTLLFLAAVAGYLLNLIALWHESFYPSDWTATLGLQVLGVFFPPVGVFMGYASVYPM